MGKAPKRTKCPECKKLGYREFHAPALRFVGAGFYCNDYGKNTISHASAKGACDEFIEGAKESSKKRMETGFQNYKVYTPDLEVLEAKGEIKKRGGEDKESIIHDNASKYREVAKTIYKHSDIDPAKQKKTNVDLMTTPDKKGFE
jgi:hypothetical protein